jgi:ribosome biogenesis GTPase
VVAAYGATCTVSTEQGEVLASIPGHLKHAAVEAAALPAVGDWVLLMGAVIQAVLDRRTFLSRRAASKATAEQAIAANMDLVLIVSAVVDDFNPRRLERYLTVAWESGASPVVVLTKADLAASPDLVVAQATGLAPGVPVIASSVVTGEGIDELRNQFGAGLTAVLVGSSGVGKSSLINRLLGQAALPTNTLRRDGRGRHTTTRRELLAMPGGGLLIDTPGLREVQLWADEGSLDQAFDDIRQLAGGCRFNDCRHDTEPGCGVRLALDDRRLAPERFAGYRKLERELRSLAVRADARLRQEEGRKWRALNKAARQRARS